MISFLSGRPIVHSDEATIIVNGVGYGVYLGSKTLAWMSQQEQVEIHIYTHVRDDALELYGFRSVEKKRLFEMMLSVSGVGPKTALAITEREPNLIVDAVQQSRVSFFQQVPRVGKKTAQKIILELKSKLGSIKELSLGPRSGKEQDVYEALMALGYDESQVSDALTQIKIDELTIQEAVKAVLRSVGTQN